MVSLCNLVIPGMITGLDTARRNRLLKSVPIGLMASFIAKTLMSIEDLLGSSPMGISVLVPKGRRKSQGESSVIHLFSNSSAGCPRYESLQLKLRGLQSNAAWEVVPRLTSLLSGTRKVERVLCPTIRDDTSS